MVSPLRWIPCLLCIHLGTLGRRILPLPPPLARPTSTSRAASLVAPRAALAAGLVAPRAQLPDAALSRGRGPAALFAEPSNTGVLESFGEGADFKMAKKFAATRTFYVAPWGEDVTAKPIFAVSDHSSRLARHVAHCAFQQFGPGARAHIENKVRIQTEENITLVVDEAAQFADADVLAAEESGAMLVYTLSSQNLGALLAEKSRERGVPCINALEPVLTLMERRFGAKREVDASDEQTLGYGEDLTIFAVSDSTGTLAAEMVKAALLQFPNASVATITVCDKVSSLEEINHIVEDAHDEDSMIVFSFANPGMSRYIRQQCERSIVPYADVFQPVVIALENYLKYPPVGVAGGHDLKEEYSPRMRWQRKVLGVGDSLYP